MPNLELKKNNDVYILDPLGSVALNGTPAAGKWSTDNTGKIVITKNDQSKVTFDVVWEFDSNNQLTVSAGDKKFNFHEIAANVPRYETRDAVLIVKPNRNQDFSFELHGDWGLTDDHDLTFTINGKSSTIDGFVNDPRSRFMFHFVNKKNLLQGSILGFVGTWSEFVDDGKLRLKFTYKRSGQTDGEFVLPKSAVIDKSINQLMYEYNKEGKSRRIQLVGTLIINDDFTINYGLDRQTSSDGTQQVSSTTFTFGAVFKKKNFTGDLELAIKKDDGTAGTTITIGGKFTAVIGTAKLKAGFTFEQNRAGNKIRTTFGFAGVLELKNGKIQWTFSTDNTATKTIVLAINVDIRVSDNINVDARLNLSMENGRLREITFFLGVAF